MDSWTAATVLEVTAAAALLPVACMHAHSYINHLYPPRLCSDSTMAEAGAHHSGWALLPALPLLARLSHQLVAGAPAVHMCHNVQWDMQQKAIAGSADRHLHHVQAQLHSHQARTDRCYTPAHRPLRPQ